MKFDFLFKYPKYHVFTNVFLTVQFNANTVQLTVQFIANNKF